jgi:hypothetical protein
LLGFADPDSLAKGLENTPDIITPSLAIGDSLIFVATNPAYVSDATTRVGSTIGQFLGMTLVRSQVGVVVHQRGWLTG